MLNVKSPEDTLEIINREFNNIGECEIVSLYDALGRVLFDNVVSAEYVPGFNRSTVDGFAIKAKESFGCSESIPAIFKLQKKINMGESVDESLKNGCCMQIPTGGFVPDGADCVVMLEHSEDYGDGTIGVLKAAAPGLNVVFKGDDFVPGKVVIEKGRRLTAADIGSLAAMGIGELKVVKRMLVGIISTGDELVDVNAVPKDGQIRNVNSALLCAVCRESGALAKDYGIVKDDEALITDTVKKAISECDMLLISGGSSAGEKDNTAKIIQKLGELYVHGIAMKPGKPTILGKIDEKPVLGLPGHPAAAFFIAKMLVKPLISKFSCENNKRVGIKAVLSEAVDSNHGRAQMLGVKLIKENGGYVAVPVISKSGLITSLAETDWCIYIDRDCEGFAKGCEVEVYSVV